MQQLVEQLPQLSSQDMAVEQLNDLAPPFQPAQISQVRIEDLALHQELIPNLQFQLGSRVCPICYVQKHSIQIMLFCCKEHSFCKGCIVSILNTNLNSFQPIKCPQQTCGVELNQDSPYFSQLKEFDRKKLQKIRRNKEVLANPQVKLCRKEQCEGVLTFETAKVSCSACKGEHCRKCLDLTHKGKCDIFMARTLQRRHHLRHCPNCKMIVEKNQGCNHMTCYCSFEFCYNCGQQLKPTGHVCQLKQPANFIQSLRAEVFRGDEFPNKQLRIILDMMQPGFQNTKLTKYIQVLLLVLTVYPIVNALTLSISLIVAGVWLVFTSVVVLLYAVMKPLIEVRVMTLGPARYMLNRDMPVWLISIILVLLYPVNFVLTLKTIPSIFETSSNNKQILQQILLIVCFFLLFPCLLIFEQDEEQI